MQFPSQLFESVSVARRSCPGRESSRMTLYWLLFRRCGRAVRICLHWVVLKKAARTEHSSRWEVWLTGRGLSAVQVDARFAAIVVKRKSNQESIHSRITMQAPSGSQAHNAAGTREYKRLDVCSRSMISTHTRKHRQTHIQMFVSTTRTCVYI